MIARRKGGRPKGSKNKKKVIEDGPVPVENVVEPATKHSVSGVLIPMPMVNTFNDVPRSALVESMTETYWDEKAHRMVLGKITPMAYVEMWDQLRLGFQRDKRGKLLEPSTDWPWHKLKEAKKQMQR